MTPTAFLLLTLALTGVAFAADAIRRARRRRALQQLAHDWQLHYAGRDRFNLAPRIAAALPTPGAAAVVVSDLLYGRVADQYLYLFTAEYTEGSVRARKRLARAVALAEPVDRERRNAPPLITVASLSDDWLQGYRTLHAQFTQPPPKP